MFVYKSMCICMEVCIDIVIYGVFTRLLQERKSLLRIWEVQLCIVKHQGFQIILLKVFFF